MPSVEDPFEEDCSSDHAKLIDSLCDLFELSWKSGEPPRIESLLEQVPEHQRWVLLRELLILDIQYRFQAQADETIAPSNYEARFPEFRGLVEELCRPLLGRSGGVHSIGISPSTESGPSHGTTQPTFRIGDRDVSKLRDYQLLEEIGRGGMGIVFRARHELLGREVALKVALEKDAVYRFRREMECIGKLDHENIANAYDASLEDIPYLVMQYVDGIDLRKLVNLAGRLSVPDACELMRQSVAGLQYAHENGLVHRDIKPGNLLLSFDGIVKILDLGLARLTASSHRNVEDLTGRGILGTLEYMAPEQADNSSAVDIRADLYSVGCTLYFLLTGEPPFRGTAAAVLLAHQSTIPPDVRTFRDDIPEGLICVLDRLLDKSREARPALPADVEMMLAPFTEGADVASLGQKTRALVASVTTDNDGSSPAFDSNDIHLDDDANSRPESGSAGDRESVGAEQFPVSSQATPRVDTSCSDAAQRAVEPDRPAATIGTSLSELPRSKRLLITICLSVLVLALMTVPSLFEPRISIPLNEHSIEASVGWEFHSNSATSPNHGPAWLRLALPESDEWTLHFNAERREGQALAIVVKDRQQSFAIRFGASIMTIDSNQRSTRQRQTDPNSFDADWGEWIGDQHRELSLSVTTDHVQLSRNEQILINEALREAAPVDSSLALPQQDGIYITTQASGFTLREVYMTSQ